MIMILHETKIERPGFRQLENKEKGDERQRQPQAAENLPRFALARYETHPPFNILHQNPPTLNIDNTNAPNI